MGNAIEDLLDGIDECPKCQSKKFRIEYISFGFGDKEKEEYYDTDEHDTKIFCADCGEVIDN